MENPAELCESFTQSDFSELVGRLREGDERAIASLFDKYFRQLAKTANRLLPQNLSKMADGEDLAQSVMRTFFRRLRVGEFSQLSDEGRLRALLRVLLERRLKNHIKHELSQKRDQRRTESYLTVSAANRSESDFDPPAQDTSEFELCEPLLLAEEIAAALAVLESDRQRKIAEFVLAGNEQSLIAQELDIHPATFYRHLNRILAIWAHRAKEGSL
ncbi:MAG: RNA polymerase sigma factor [Pirellulaceae bacterium]